MNKARLFAMAAFAAATLLHQSICFAQAQPDRQTTELIQKMKAGQKSNQMPGEYGPKDPPGTVHFDDVVSTGDKSITSLSLQVFALKQKITELQKQNDSLEDQLAKYRKKYGAN